MWTMVPNIPGAARARVMNNLPRQGLLDVLRVPRQVLEPGTRSISKTAESR